MFQKKFNAVTSTIKTNFLTKDPQNLMVLEYSTTLV